MRNWTRRGLRAALFTGGMMTLGAGIASASEQSPAPSVPLNGSINIPIRLCNNAIGTPIGQLDSPCFEQQIVLDSRQLTDNVPAPLRGPNAAKGSQGGLNIVLPLDFSGNAVAAGGTAVSHNESHREYLSAHPLATRSDGGPLSGNAGNVDLALPLQFNGNAFGVGGHAIANNDSTVVVRSDTPISTNGEGGQLTGNALNTHMALPIEITGNGMGFAGGEGETHSRSSATAVSSGSTWTGGKGGQLAGNVMDLPLALPIEVNGNGLGMFGGHANANSDTMANASSGGEVRTGGDDGSFAGDLLRPALAMPVAFNGNAGGLFMGTAETHGSSGGVTKAGPGALMTNGVNSKGSGEVVDIPLAPATSVFGNGFGMFGGSADAHHNRDITATAGDGVFTNGDGSQGGGNIISTPLAGPFDVAGTGFGWNGEGRGEGNDRSTVTAGGYNGTRGFDSAGAGNIVNTPIALPVQAIGNGLGMFGVGDGKGTNDTHSKAGGVTSCVDDAGALSCNVVSTPVAGPVGVFGNGIGFVGTWTGDTEHSDVSADAGGPIKATGAGGTIAGNVLTPPISVPTQVFGNAFTMLGQASGRGHSTTVSSAGGEIMSDGDHGTLTGNIGQFPITPVTQVFGNAGILGGTADADATNKIDAHSGGDVHTNGDGGTGAGNAGQLPIAPLTQIYGTSILAGGSAHSFAPNTTRQNVGGDVVSSGRHAIGSGNLGAVPVATLIAFFGNSFAGGGTSGAFAPSDTMQRIGGNLRSDGTGGTGSGTLLSEPVGIVDSVSGNSIVGAGTSQVMADAVTSQTVGGDLISNGIIGSLPIAERVKVLGIAAGILGHSDLRVHQSDSSDVGGSDKALAGIGLPGSLVGPVIGDVKSDVTNDNSMTVAGHPLPDLPLSPL